MILNNIYFTSELSILKNISAQNLSDPPPSVLPETPLLLFLYSCCFLVLSSPFVICPNPLVFYLICVLPVSERGPNRAVKTSSSFDVCRGRALISLFLEVGALALTGRTECLGRRKLPTDWCMSLMNLLFSSRLSISKTPINIIFFFILR